VPSENPLTFGMKQRSGPSGDETKPSERARMQPSPRDASGALFAYATPSNAAALSAALPAPAREIHYVRIDRALIEGKSSPFWQKPGVGRLAVPWPDGTSLVVAIEGSEMLGPDRFVSTGRVEGHPLSRTLFAWHGGFLHASIEDPVLGRFALRAATEAYAQFYQIDSSQVLPCGGGRMPSLESGPRRSANSAWLAPGTSVSVTTAAADAADRSEVHVMMLYTQSVLTTMTGAARSTALQSAFDLAIAKVNASFEASLIMARVKLVGIAETTLVDDQRADARAGWQDEVLTALYEEKDGKMDEIHALRDRVGADIVCIALNRSDTRSSGLSFVLGAAEEEDAAENARYAFSVVQYSSIAGTSVVPHEIGHVLGCAHDRQNATNRRGKTFAGAYSYSYGHRFVGTNGRQYRDIMAYPPGTELSYFSNPNVVVPLPVGLPIGIVAGQPGEADNARTIEKTALAAALYRLHTQPNASQGSLINVATRAHVGTDDQVLIGGFIVQGTQPKTMLIRAAGPTLATFGVANVLADPVLRIFASGQIAAENDNWSISAGAGTAAAASEIALAAERAGAFPFPSASADSAVLITLAPGAYTAVVEGSRETTGIGLVEAYEMDRDAGRVVNLSTRAYADREGREMFGGFVVQAAPGVTKRLLIRVLGPTLARPPFNMSGTLSDPELELRNAAGELLVRNDDWSSNSVGGISEVNDFSPVVEAYGEQQIFATGHAPKNRREPCVLVDLPPGAYTVTVRPFERRHTNPQLEQLAEPGVGVVEVYEIGR